MQETQHIPQHYAMLIVSGHKEPIFLSGVGLVHDVKYAIHSYMKSTTKPVCKKDGMVWYNNYFEIDEFCITFLDWIRVHECSDPGCVGREMRNTLVDHLSDKCIEQTVMFIDGQITEHTYKAYQMIVNLLHLGTTMSTAKLVAQRECGIILFDNADHLIQYKN